MKKFLDKPITWGSYLNFAGIMMILSMICMIPYIKWWCELLGVDWKDCLPESWRKKIEKED